MKGVGGSESPADGDPSGGKQSHVSAEGEPAGDGTGWERNEEEPVKGDEIVNEADEKSLEEDRAGRGGCGREEECCGGEPGEGGELELGKRGGPEEADGQGRERETA